jgi:integrase
MGSIEPYQTAKGRRYRVRYRTPEHRQVERGAFRTKRDAEEYLAGVETAKARGDYIDPARGSAVLRDVAEEWFRGQVQLKPTTRGSYRSALDKHILPRWGDQHLATLRHGAIQAWIGDLSRELSPQSVRNIYTVLNLVLSYAVRDRRLERNPATGATLPRRVRATRGYLSHAQLHRLAVECGPYGGMILFLGYTGLRWGEAAALRVRDVVPERRRIEVARAVTEPGGRLVYGTPKTHTRRSVPYPTLLSPVIDWQRAGRSPDDLLFRSPENEPLRNANFRQRVVEPAVGRIQNGYTTATGAQVAPDPAFPRITPHDLRHTAASLAISAGANVKAVQRMLGHASATMTLDVYADLFADDLEEVSNALDRAAASSNSVALPLPPTPPGLSR